MEIDAYLERIGRDGPREPTGETLARIHRAHMLAVPFAEFDATCRHHQPSLMSIFTRKVVCSRATPDGRITLSNNRLIATAGERREIRLIAHEAEYRAMLRTRFKIDRGEEASIARLLVPPAPPERPGP